MHITFLALSPTVWVIGTIIFFVTTLIVSLILYRNAHVGQCTIAAQASENENLRGIVTERDGIIKRLQDENTRILREYEELEQKYNGNRIDVASLDAEKLLKTISDLTAENAEQLEKIGEKERTIKQQQQIIDDLKIECQRILAQRDDGSRLSAQKPAPRKGGKP